MAFRYIVYIVYIVWNCAFKVPTGSKVDSRSVLFLSNSTLERCESLALMLGPIDWSINSMLDSSPEMFLDHLFRSKSIWKNTRAFWFPLVKLNRFVDEFQVSCYLNLAPLISNGSVNLGLTQLELTGFQTPAHGSFFIEWWAILICARRCRLIYWLLLSVWFIMECVTNDIVFLFVFSPQSSGNTIRRTHTRGASNWNVRWNSAVYRQG